VNRDKAETEAARIRDAYGVRCLGIGIDLRDMEAIGAALAQTRQELSRIGGLVHAAGTCDAGSLEGVTSGGWDDLINLHLKSLVMLVQALALDFKANPGSAVVAIASINATLGNAANPIYSAAKGGMLSLVRSLADRLAQDGTRINSVSPGQIRTPIIQATLEKMPGFFERRILLGRIGEAAEIGRVVRFLLSDEASYITAAELIVDGGNVSSQRG
jgi:NAD(P)-dependent dehydrogenase (short-subunit alcohol dehydrogenase family)